MTVDTGDPEREVGSLVARAHVQLGRLLLIFVPHQQTDVVSGLKLEILLNTFR